MKKTDKKIAISAAVITIIILLFIIRHINANNKNIVKPRLGPIVEAVYALGTVKSDKIYNLKIGISSTIKKLYVTEGQSIARGGILLSTDAGVSFYAPFQGAITRVYCEEGEIVLPGSQALTMMDLRKTYVQVSLDQNSALRIRKGQRAELSVETIRGRKLTGVVESIYPSNGQFLARIGIASMPPEVLPDMTADVAIEVARKENALLIPLVAIKNGVVLVRRDRKRKNIMVSVGAIDGAWGEVLDNSIKSTDEIFIEK
jgi:membrane fusion protein, macrolide-specific efflux system